MSEHDGRLCFPGLLLLIALFPGRSSGQLVINEFLASPTGVQEEFVELLNTGASAIAVDGISFRDERTDWVFVAPDSAALLDSGDLLVLAAAPQPAWPGVEFLDPGRWPSLNNAGDSLIVRVGGTVTDRVGYRGNERGRSMERIDPAIPGHVANNWAPSADASGGTPGRLNSRFQPDVTPPRLLAAEFDPPSTLILWLSESIDPLSLGNLRIDAGGASTGAHAVAIGNARLLMSIAGASPPSAVTAGGVTDYAGHTMPDTSVSIARPVTAGSVRLSEMLVEAGSSPDDLPEFVELVSAADHPVSLRRAYLAIGVGPEPNVAALSAPDSTRILDPEEMLLAYASPASNVAAAHVGSIIESSLVPGKTRVEIVPVDASDLTLRNTGDHVRLITHGGSEVDAAVYGPDMTDSRFRSHKGRSLRRADDLPLNAPAWVSTLDERGATPGIRDPVIAVGSMPRPGDLKFSELMPRPLADPVDGRFDQPEYIEIVNGSTRMISLNGLRLSGPVMDDGSVDVRRIGFQPLTLEPGGVALFYELPTTVGDETGSQFKSLAHAFPLSYPGGVEFGQREASLGRGGILSGGRGLLIPVRGAVSLRDDGDILRLLGPDGAVIDSIAYNPSMHHPAVSDPTGRALERTVLSLAPLMLGDWSTSTVAGGGSPGLLPRGPGPPPSSPQSGPVVRLRPKTISPDGDGTDDRTVLLAENLEPGTVIRAYIFDIDGRLVRRLVPGTIAAGTFSTDWSGLDEANRPVARGFYVVLVRVLDADSGGQRMYKLPIAVVR